LSIAQPNLDTALQAYQELLPGMVTMLATHRAGWNICHSEHTARREGQVTELYWYQEAPCVCVRLQRHTADHAFEAGYGC
jgi:hypothetical protein